MFAHSLSSRSTAKPSLPLGRGGPRTAPAFNPRWQQIAQTAPTTAPKPGATVAGGRRPSVTLQAKLAISQPDDPLEIEADQVADRVMRMAGPPDARMPPQQDTSPVLSRKCAACADEDVLQRQPRDGAAGAMSAPPIVEAVLGSPGLPLDEQTLGFMEPRFERDFRQVRVHHDALAGSSARAVGAHAYTVGSHLVFGAGEYAPASPAGRHLLAHELAHVVQQSNPAARASAPSVQRADDPQAGDPLAGDAGEATPAAAGRSQVKDFSRFSPSADMDVAAGRAFAERAIAIMSPHGANISRPPSEAIASAGGGGPIMASSAFGGPADGMLQTSALSGTVQRSGGGRVKPEAGFVGSLQLCYDMCNAEFSVVGWVWAGAGVVTKGLFGGASWWGAYVFGEKEFFKTTLGFMPTVNCGTCAPGCKPDDKTTEWGGGVGGFPVALKPGEKAKLGKAGIEVGALLTPHLARCDADLEVIALIDITKYLGPVGAAVSSAIAAANELGEKLGVEIDCGVGVDISGTVHLCKSVPGGGVLGITSDSAKICGGGYLGCGIGLSHDKAALPGI